MSGTRHTGNRQMQTSGNQDQIHAIAHRFWFEQLRDGQYQVIDKVLDASSCADFPNGFRKISLLSVICYVFTTSDLSHFSSTSLNERSARVLA